MGHIYCLMGKSACGKDTIFSMLIDDKELNLSRIVPYTTRPIRSEETDGDQYHFTDEDGLADYRSQGKVIEERCYHTIHGDWFYFTVDDGLVKEDADYLVIGTIEVFTKLSEYYGKERVIPLYIEIDDGERLERALKRERSQDNPKYAELCRRFLADASDFSEENIKSAGIDDRFRFDNNELDKCVLSLKNTIINN